MCHSYDRLLERCEKPVEKEIWTRLLQISKDNWPSTLKELNEGEWRIIHPSGQLLLVEGKPRSFLIGGSQPKDGQKTMTRGQVMAILDREYNKELGKMESQKEAARRQRISESHQLRARDRKITKDAKRNLQNVQIMSVLEAVPTMRVPLAMIKKKVMGKHAFAFKNEEEYGQAWDDLMLRLSELVFDKKIQKLGDLFWVEEAE